MKFGEIRLLPFVFCLTILLGCFLFSGGSWWAVGWGLFGWLCFVLVVEIAFVVNRS